MITDQQFIDGMHAAVKQKGPQHIAAGAYVDRHGEAYCIVGYALGVIDKGLVPHTNEHLAMHLLLGLGCSERVAMAASVAQAANDYRVPWGQVLPMFEKAMSLYTPGMRQTQMMDVFAEEIRQAHVMSIMKPLQKGYVGPSFGTVIYDDGSTAALAAECIVSFSALTIASIETANALDALLAQPVLKKDHALVA